MHSLFDALLAQHTRQLTPVRCAHSTIAQLHRYFEDVVLENNLSALVIESLPSTAKRTSREISRIRNLARQGRRTFFFVSQNDDLADSVAAGAFTGNFAPVLFQHPGTHYANEHFVVIADARFSALLATVRTSNQDNGADGDEVIWSFEPDVVYSALEYLQARVRAEHPYHASVFSNAVRSSMPKATSLQLTLAVTTKLAHLLQEQAGREIAVNRIATAIRESLELGMILQKTVKEVGAALSVAGCILRVHGNSDVQSLTYSYFAGPEKEEKLRRDEVTRDLEAIASQILRSPQPITRDGSEDSDTEAEQFPFAVVPLVFQERLIGILQVIDDDASRTWQENELLLLRTVANQVAVAINHANLFAQMQQQALTDALTGCYNRRSFEMQLDRELQVSTRLHQPLSLVMLDLDHFKELNDSVGHEAGDAALRRLSECFKQELRGVDTASRFGGDEFTLLLPQAYAEGALKVAERLRESIERIEIPGFGHLSASIGIASFPSHASTRADLLLAADAALYSAKRAGRNRVAIFDITRQADVADMLPAARNVRRNVEQTM